MTDKRKMYVLNGLESLQQGSNMFSVFRQETIFSLSLSTIVHMPIKTAPMCRTLVEINPENSWRVQETAHHIETANAAT